MMASSTTALAGAWGQQVVTCGTFTTMSSSVGGQPLTPCRFGAPTGKGTRPFILWLKPRDFLACLL
jgi:hypothetical protein